MASAHYDPNSKSIHVKGDWLSVTTLVHETAHHIHGVERYGGAPHGDEFLEIEKMLFEISLGWFVR